MSDDESDSIKLRRLDDIRIGELLQEVKDFKGKVEGLERAMIERLIPLEQEVQNAKILMAKVEGIEKGRTQIFVLVAAAMGWALGYFQDFISSILKIK